MTKIKSLIPKNNIIVNLQQTDKMEAIATLARFISHVSGLPDADEAASKIIEREMEMSTGIGYGIAIPHARLTSIDKLYMAAARISEGIAFEALDDRPVHLIFMMISPANTSAEHTQVLSTLSQIMSQEEVRQQLLQADTPETFADILAEAEDKYVVVQ